MKTEFNVKKNVVLSSKSAWYQVSFELTVFPLSVYKDELFRNFGGAVGNFGNIGAVGALGAVGNVGAILLNRNSDI